MHLLTSDYCLNTFKRVKLRSSKNLFSVSRIIYRCIGGRRSVIFRHIFILPPIFLDLLHSMICIKIFWQMVYACKLIKLILTKERIIKFVISVQLIIYAKQNGVKYTTISATGTMAQIGWRRLLLGHGDEAGSFLQRCKMQMYPAKVSQREEKKKTNKKSKEKKDTRAVSEDQKVKADNGYQQAKVLCYVQYSS